MGITIKKKGDKWYVFVNYQGRRKAKCIGSRAAAEQVKRVLEAKLALGDLGFLDTADEKGLTFQEYADRWLIEYAAVHCKPSTVSSYRQLLRLYLKPQFGSMPLEQITRESVKSFLSALAAKTKTDRRKSAKKKRLAKAQRPNRPNRPSLSFHATPCGSPLAPFG